MDSALQKVEEFAQALEKHKVPPDDEDQKVIEQVGDSRDASALFVLRRALNAAIEYQVRSKDMAKSEGPNSPLTMSILITGDLARRMESRLRSAIEKCTPEGQPVIYELISERKEGSEEPSNIPNQQPKVKRNIGCGVILILVAFGTLSSFLKGGTGGNTSFLLGGLLVFAVMIYFGIRMIKGKKI